MIDTELGCLTRFWENLAEGVGVWETRWETSRKGSTWKREGIRGMTVLLRLDRIRRRIKIFCDESSAQLNTLIVVEDSIDNRELF